MKLPANSLWSTGFLGFPIRFVLLFIVFYYSNIAFIGITAPGNNYIPFVDQYLNYIDLLRHTILHAAKAIAGFFSYEPEIQEPYLLHIKDGPGVRIVYDCIGYGVMSFWTAFVLAHKGSWQHKLSWALGGCFFIWLINCIRVAALLMALSNKWNINKYIEHHAMFNILAYCLIFCLAYDYSRRLPLT